MNKKRQEKLQKALGAHLVKDAPKFIPGVHGSLHLAHWVSTECKFASDGKTEGETEKEFEQRWDLKSVPEKAHSPSEIQQGLLIEKDDCNLRVRKESKDGKDFYTMTCKYYVKNDEAEVEITKEMFDRLWQEIPEASRMEKTRWRFGDWEIDDIRTPAKMKGVRAELETAKKDQKIEVPKEFDVIQKVNYE